MYVRLPSEEARRRQFLRIGKLLRNEDEAMIFVFIEHRSRVRKKLHNCSRWVDRIIAQGELVIKEFMLRLYNAAELYYRLVSIFCVFSVTSLNKCF